MKNFKFLLLSLTLLIASCTPLISLYDGQTFKDTTDLKARCLILMSHGNEPYAGYAKEADAVLATAWSLYERQKARDRNALTFAQWQLLMDDKVMLDKVAGTESILPKYFENWQKGGMSSAYIDEKRKVVSKAFDEIIKLENAKIKQTTN